jgi:hypothetical protein
MTKKRKPYNKSTGRTYEYDTAYQASPEQKKNRAARNKARATLMKEGKVKKFDGKDVGHSDSNPKNNKRSNLKVESRAKNRGKVDKNGKRI